MKFIVKLGEYMKFKLKANKPLSFEELQQIGESLNWSITNEGDSIYISQYSPAGEDFGFYIDSDGDLGKQIMQYAYDFDIDEHIEMWLDAKRSGTSGVPSVRELVEDAKDISKMLDELADAVFYNRK